MKHLEHVLSGLLALSLLANEASAQTGNMTLTNPGRPSMSGLEVSLTNPDETNPGRDDSSKQGLVSTKDADQYWISLQNVSKHDIRLCSSRPTVTMVAVGADGHMLHTQGFVRSGKFIEEDLPPGNFWSGTGIYALVILDREFAPGMYSITARVSATVCHPDRKHVEQFEISSGTMNVSLGSPQERK